MIYLASTLIIICLLAVYSFVDIRRNNEELRFKKDSINSTYGDQPEEVIFKSNFIKIIIISWIIFSASPPLPPMVGWFLVGIPEYPVAKFLRPNDVNADTSGSNDIDFLSNGIKVRTSNNPNTNNSTYVFMAFAEQIGDSPYHTDTNAR